jgi:mannose-6-phosphate isomerase-like protein (cupin superfamily)
MPAVAVDFGADEGRNVLIDLAQTAAGASGSYSNLVLTRVDDHVVRMSVMTEPFYWHRHPNSDELFLVLDGVLLLKTSQEQIELSSGQLYTIPAGLAHSTSPISERSVKYHGRESRHGKRTAPRARVILTFRVSTRPIPYWRVRLARCAVSLPRT